MASTPNKASGLCYSSFKSNSNTPVVPAWSLADWSRNHCVSWVTNHSTVPHTGGIKVSSVSNFQFCNLNWAQMSKVTLLFSENNAAADCTSLCFQKDHTWKGNKCGKQRSYMPWNFFHPWLDKIPSSSHDPSSCLQSFTELNKMKKLKQLPRTRI